MNSSWNSGVNLKPDQQQPTVVATTYMGDEHFLDSFGIELVAGRYFTAEELIPSEAFSGPGLDVAIPGVVVTRALAERRGLDAAARHWRNLHDRLREALLASIAGTRFRTLVTEKAFARLAHFPASLLLCLFGEGFQLP